MYILLLCMVIHFIADFLMQSREMGQKKSSEFHWLFMHLAIQHGMFAICLAPFVGLKSAVIFATCNAVIHGVIDWNIWRLYKLSVAKRLLKLIKEDTVSKTWPGFESEAAHDMVMFGGKSDREKILIAARTWRYWEDHWFYSTIGFDQMLHAATIIVLVGTLL